MAVQLNHKICGVWWHELCRNYFRYIVVMKESPCEAASVLYLRTTPPQCLTRIHKSMCRCCIPLSLRWRHNGHDGVSNHQPHHYFLNRLVRRRSKKTSKLHVTGLCAGNSPMTAEFPAQVASDAENVSIWWRHHVVIWHAAVPHNPQCHSKGVETW